VKSRSFRLWGIDSGRTHGSAPGAREDDLQEPRERPDRGVSLTGDAILAASARERES